MKIAIVNYRYFVSGGPERYMFNIKEILEKKGHEVIPFSVKHNKNIKNDYEHYFLDPIGTGNEVYNHEYPKDIKTKLQVTSRVLYSFEAYRKFKRFLTDVKPDVVYILYFQNKISCSIIDAAKEMKLPVVQRISDFAHICPNALFFREKKGICEECVTKNLFQAIKHKCISDSYSYSILKTLSLGIMNARNIKQKIDAFVFPSSFTMSKYIEAGFDSEKVSHIPTFFNANQLSSIGEISYGNFALYFGRIEKEKGIETLIDAFLKTNYKLKIIGFSSDNFEELMKEKIVGRENQIEFLGKMDFPQIAEYLSKCLFTIMPSEWYENFPNTVLESFAYKKAVVANNIGSLPEIVNITNGFCYNYNSSESLKEKVEYMFEHPEESKLKGENGLKSLILNFSGESHYLKLVGIFNRLLENIKVQTVD